MEKMLSRFMRYIAMDTKSDPDSQTCPSTPGQSLLADVLVDDLKKIGIEARRDEHGYVYGEIPATAKGPTIALIAHMDTSPDMDGRCLHPRRFRYEGGDIVLNEDYRLTEKEFPFLKDLIGHELISTDGTTLLGADDKAGISIIMAVADHLMNEPSIPHGKIVVAFTPDEEIGRGADLFDVAGVGADFAYTIDGGPLGELEFENFNAASAKIHIQGKNVHPGSAKHIMINALQLAMEIHAMLPVGQRPELTEGYEGFYMLDSLEGSVEEAEMSYIIRDHDREKFEEKKARLRDIVAFMERQYGKRLTLTLKDSYYNMREKVEPHREIIDLAIEAMKKAGVEPVIKAIRGGTDGAQLSYKGLPTPNLFTGGFNYHGRYEILSVDIMKKAFETVMYIVQDAPKMMA